MTSTARIAAYQPQIPTVYRKRFDGLEQTVGARRRAQRDRRTEAGAQSPSAS